MNKQNRDAFNRNILKRKGLKTEMPHNQENDEAWKVAELATRLVTDRFAKLKTDAGTTSNNDGTLYNEIEAAIDRAELIIDRVKRRGERDVHLYQAFQEGDEMSQADVRKRIKEIGWYLASNNTLDTRLAEIRDEWEVRLYKLLHNVCTDHHPQDMAREKIRTTLAELCSDDEVKSAFPQLGESSNTLLRGLAPSPLDAPDLGCLEAQWAEEQALNMWCIDSKPANNGNSNYTYRPYELFLYTEQFDWFHEKLRFKKRADLSETFRPGPIRSAKVMYLIEFNKLVWKTPEGGTCKGTVEKLAKLKEAEEQKLAQAKTEKQATDKKA